MASEASESSEHEDETQSKTKQMEDSTVNYMSYEDEDALDNQEISTSPQTDKCLNKYLALLFLELVYNTEEFYMTRNMENVGCFNDIVYRHKDKDSNDYSTHYVKFVSTDQNELNLFEAYLSYELINRKPKYNEQLNANEYYKFELVIANKIVLRTFHLHAYLDEDSDKSPGLMRFNNEFASILIKDTATLKECKKSLNLALQFLVSCKTEMLSDVLDDLKKKLNLKCLQEMLSPENYMDHGQFIRMLESIKMALKNEIDWKNFCLNLKVYALEQTCKTRLVTLLRNKLWNMYEFPLMITDTIITKLLAIFTEQYADHHRYCHIRHTNLHFWHQIIRKHSQDAFSTIRRKNISKLRNVRYKKEVVNTLESLVRKHQVIHIVPPANKSNKLTLWKIVQLLCRKNHFFIDDKVLQFHWREFSHLWLASDIAVLINEGGFWDPQAIIHLLKDTSSKKLIVVGEDCHQTKMLAYNLCHKYTRYEDNLNANQLIECLCFDSRSFKLNGVPLYKVFNQNKEMKAMAAQETFDQLLNYGQLKAFHDEANDVSYTLFRYHYIHEEVIYEAGHVFGVKGDVKQLRCLKPFQKKRFERGISKTLPCMEIDNRNDFMAVCKKRSNVHWLQLKNNNLIWLESKGNIEAITKHVINTAPAVYSVGKEHRLENELPGRLVLIIDDCDRGILDYIMKCKEKFIPKYFIFSIQLRDCVLFLEKSNITFEGLMEKSTSTCLHKELFKFALKETDRAEVFLNSCGSLEPVHHSKMAELINELLENTLVRKVWITADRKHKEMLEASFSTLAFTAVEGEVEKCKILKAADIAAQNGWNDNEEYRGNNQPFELEYSERACRGSLLHKACQSGNLNKVKHLILQENADIDSTDSSFYQTPLMWAVKSGKENIVDFLIQKGAKTTLYDKNGVSAIHLAAASRDIETVRCLVCLADMDINTVDDLRRTPLMWAVMNSDLNMVKYLIKNGASPICKDVFNNNLLMLAVVKGSLPVIKFLLLRKETQAFINSRNSKRETPLILAVKNNFITIAIILLKHGAKADLQDRRGQTALHVALRQDNAKMFKILMQWFPNYCLTTTDSQGKTILHLAAKHGNTEVFRYLEKYECNESVCNVRSKVWWNLALHYAAKHGHLEITKWLIQHGSKVNALDRRDYTPLHWASFNGHTNIVQVLLDNGADVNKCNYIFQTPAHVAAMNGQADTVRELWLYGADLNATDHKKQTPFIRARQNKCKNVMFLLKQF